MGSMLHQLIHFAEDGIHGQSCSQPCLRMVITLLGHHVQEYLVRDFENHPLHEGSIELIGICFWTYTCQKMTTLWLGYYSSIFPNQISSQVPLQYCGL